MDKNEAVEILKELPERIAAVIMPSDRFFDYKGALSYAVSHLEADRWIPVSERLPDKADNYLVTVRAEWDYEECIFVDKVAYDIRGKFITDDEVLAWRPLPKPYESEAGNERD